MLRIAAGLLQPRPSLQLHPLNRNKCLHVERRNKRPYFANCLLAHTFCLLQGYTAYCAFTMRQWDFLYLYRLLHALLHRLLPINRQDIPRLVGRITIERIDRSILPDSFISFSSMGVGLLPPHLANEPRANHLLPCSIVPLNREDIARKTIAVLQLLHSVSI